MGNVSTQKLAQMILEMIFERGKDKTICKPESEDFAAIRKYETEQGEHEVRRDTVQEEVLVPQDLSDPCSHQVFIKPWGFGKETEVDL